jgi:hypothetical protein
MIEHLLCVGFEERPVFEYLEDKALSVSGTGPIGISTSHPSQ